MSLFEKWKSQDPISRKIVLCGGSAIALSLSLGGIGYFVLGALAMFLLPKCEWLSNAHQKTHDPETIVDWDGACGLCSCSLA